MILPIVAYGDPVLKKVATPITAEYEGLNELIENMFETMYSSRGVGLAAPQIGKSIRIFIVDAKPFAEDEDYKDQGLENFKKVFINAEIIKEEGEAWRFNEGCLSIPEIREDVERYPDVTLRYYDEHFVEHTEVFSGIAARIIQHEYDHIEGKLFIDRISPLKKRLLEKRLLAISKGEVRVDYKMKFPYRAKRK